jgi:histidyl-tRNA synthetase
MGGPNIPGVGLAMGMDRMLMLAQSAGMGEKDGKPRLEVAFVALDEESARTLVPLMNALRTRGVAADMDYTRRNIDKQLRSAGESGAQYAVIVGEDERSKSEATIQNLATRERSRLSLDSVEAELAHRLDL